MVHLQLFFEVFRFCILLKSVEMGVEIRALDVSQFDMLFETPSFLPFPWSRHMCHQSN